MKFSIQTLIWTLVLIALLIVGAMALVPKPVEVEVAKVTEGELQITVREDGITRIREKYIVSTPVAGRLSRIELKPGDEICDQSSLIAVIVPAEPTMLDARSKAQARARVDQANAALKRAQASAQQVAVNYQRSKSSYERLKKLADSNAISNEEYDAAKAEYLSDSQAIRTSEFDSEIAKYELQMAQAALLQFDEGNENVKPFEVFAPVHGKVLRVFQESSAVVSVGTPLVEMGDPKNLEIEIDVLSTDAVRIRPGAHLSIEHWGGENPLKGIVRVVEPAAFTKVSSLGVEEQRVNIIADFDEPPERLVTLGDGYRVESKITIRQIESALLVPNSSLFRHEKEWHVFAILNQRAELRPVRIGQQNETHTQIVEGLSRGDEVVLYPGDTIADESAIKRVN